MNINLYPCFKHWLSTEGNKNNAIWFYSDPHFADTEMPYIRKNYIGDEEQVKRINSKVGKNDTIIFLGDIMANVKTIEINEDIFSNNNKTAEETRRSLRDSGCYFINIMSSPGSGKTTLLTKLIPLLQKRP